MQQIKLYTHLPHTIHMLIVIAIGFQYVQHSHEQIHNQTKCVTQCYQWMQFVLSFVHYMKLTLRYQPPPLHSNCCHCCSQACGNACIACICLTIKLGTLLALIANVAFKLVCMPALLALDAIHLFAIITCIIPLL
jgi:hypothetical protein